MIQSLDRGIQILSILANNENLGVTEIAQRLEVDKSTASRLIETLRFHDMVQLDVTGKYRLGLRILNLSEALKRNMNILTFAKPILMKLSQELNESVHLCAYNNSMAYIVDQVKSKKKYTLLANIGLIEPLHSSSVGKCILAYKSKERIEAILEGYYFERFTKNTITSKEELIQQLQQIKAQGYAEDIEEMVSGVTCIAAPVFNHKSQVKYSIGISGPTNNLDLQEKKRYIKKLVITANAISKELGFGFNE